MFNITIYIYYIKHFLFKKNLLHLTKKEKTGFEASYCQASTQVKHLCTLHVVSKIMPDQLTKCWYINRSTMLMGQPDTDLNF